MAFKIKCWPFEVSASGKVNETLLTGFGLAGIVGFLFGGYKYATQSENSGKYLGIAGFGAAAAFGSFYYAEMKEEQQDIKNNSEVDASKVEVTNDSNANNSVNDKNNRIKEATFEDVVNSASSADFKPLIANWISSGGIYVLAAPTGTGKSILAIQMGIDIATGMPSKLVPGDVNKAPQRVLYYNGELKDQDFGNRYGKNGVEFPKDNFKLISGRFNSFEDFLIHLESKAREQSSDCTIFVDNLTTYAGQDITCKLVNDLFDTLERIQWDANQNGWSITVVLVAHTNKDCEDKHIKLKDISGSTTLETLATGIFGLANTEVDDIKILHDLKKRRKGMKKEVRLKRESFPYVHFELVDDGQNLVDSSDENLQNKQSQQHTNSSPSNSTSSSANTQQVNPDIVKMTNLRSTGKTDVEIAKEMRCSRETVYRKIGPKNPRKK